MKCLEPEELVRPNPVLLEELFSALAMSENQSSAKIHLYIYVKIWGVLYPSSLDIRSIIKLLLQFQ